MVALIISIVALLVSTLATYKIFSIEEDTLMGDCNNLEIYDDLERRIEAIEAGIKSQNENIRILASNLNELDVIVVQLKAKVSNLDKTDHNLSVSINNIIAFADKTRGMVDEIKKDLEK